jgi:hypothetical protein
MVCWVKEGEEVRLLQMISGRTMLIVTLVGLATLWLPFGSDKSTARAKEPPGTNLQEQGEV